MSETPQGLQRLVLGWVEFVQRRAIWVLALAALLAVGLVHYTAGHLAVNTNTEDMLSASLPWRQAEARLDRAFPQLSDVLVAVIDADTPDAAARAQRRLVARLKTQPKFFASVFAPETEPYFQREGLLFLKRDELRKLGDRLSQAQPFLGSLASNPSLDGLATLLRRALGSASSAGFDLAPALQAIAGSVRSVASGDPRRLSWQSLTTGAAASQDGEGRRRFIQVVPYFDYSQILPAGAAIKALRKDAAALGIDGTHGVRLQLTGDVAMEQQELQEASSGAILALGVALVMVAVLLFLALRSPGLVLAAVLTLIYGLLVTATFAAAAVGHLNMISIAFGLLYVGLGIDYALYLCMQYRDRLTQGLTPKQALPMAAGDVGGFMLICALTTSLAFFAFIPTDFVGIAELGLISGVGMFISLVVSLTLLPALIAVLPTRGAVRRQREGGVYAGVAAWPYRHARGLWIGAGLVALGAAALASQTRFDFNPLDLRDPHSESVRVFEELLRDPNIPTLTLSAIEPNEQAARTLATRLSSLPLVKQTVTLADFVPTHQQAKLAMLSDLQFTLGPTLSGDLPRHPHADPQDLAALRKLHQALAQPPAGQNVAAVQAAASLHQALGAFLEQVDAAATAKQKDQRLAQLRDALLGGLPQQLAQLATALSARTVTLADVPSDLKRRWVDAQGQWRVEIWPAKVLDHNAAIAAFVDQVQSVAPHAVGGPLVMVKAGQAMVRAFRHAFAYSFIAITLLLLILLRSVGDTLLVLAPLVLAGLYTAGAMVLLGVPFNFANVIALPLVLGVGVDYGVYIVQRGRAAARDGSNLLRSSTARAVAFGGLITIANFGNLMLAKHPGMVSMGLLLTLGLAATLFCALVLLPSLIAWRYGAPRDL
jgi:hopanoid biosynthesis associated RND transporter like protein HpnN